jgi:hypothetical protein
MTPAALAAAEVARDRLGIVCDNPLELPGLANAVFWLRPHPVVAKVGTRGGDLVLEHRVASALHALGAPVAEPIGPPVQRPEISAVVTLWVRLETLDDDPPDAELGASLRAVHDALARLGEELPPLRDQLVQAQQAASNHRAMSSLPRDDLAMLREAHAVLLERYDSARWKPAGIHGEPHWGNRLHTPDGIRWIDFEGACTGPREWDLSFLPVAALVAFPDVDRDLLQLMRTIDAARRGTFAHLVAHMPGMPEFRDEQLAVVRTRLSDNPR